MMRTKRDQPRLLLRGQGVLFDALARELRARPPSSDCAVAVTAHDVPDPERDLAAQRHLGRLGVPWLPVWADHVEVWAGPWVIPGGTPCIACVGARAGAPELLGDGAAGGPPRGPGFLPAWLARLLAAVVARELTGCSLLRGRALIWDLASLHPRLHPVSRVPGCPACPPGAGDSPGAARWSFEPVLAPSTGAEPADGDGPPLERLVAALVSPRAGLVRGVTLVDGPLPLAVAELVVGDAAGRRLVLSGGRGTSADEARRIALFEALERHAGLAPGGRRHALRAAYREMNGSALDPRTLILHSPDQYDAPGFPYRPFDESRELTWVWGYSLRDRRPRAVPAGLVYYGSWTGRPAEAGDERLAYDTSSGCALGRTMAEAVARALLEVMERDAFLLAWYARRTRAPLDLSFARDWRTVLLVRRLERLGHSVMAWDVTQDLGVPAVWVMAVCEAPGRPRTFSSCGCHPDPEVAAWSALSEVASGLPNLAREYRREPERAAAMWSDPRSVRTMADHGLLYAAPQAEEHLGFLLRDRRDRLPLREWSGARDGWSESWAARSGRLVDAVAGAGLDAIAVDQTTPEQAALGLAAARVLVPGALPMTFGHGARRLAGADRLTRRLEAAGADGVNPWPHPFP
jgi:ribosomal protein S12 methylthiotransferase accessory factor